MLELTPYTGHATPGMKVDGQITLDFDQRNRSRLRACLDDKTEVGIFQTRGHCLRDGELLESASGEIIRVCAAKEPVSAVYAKNHWMMSRLCYHLGNRHVSLEIGDGRVAYKPDHVLDDMVRGFGVEPVPEAAAFEPESGAYGHHHAHD